MLALANLSARWAMPADLKAITLGVLGIFAASGVSAGIRKATGRTASEGPAHGGAEGAPSAADRRVQLLRLLAERGPLSAEEAAHELGVVRSTAWRMLEALEKEGRVTQSAANNPNERRYSIKN
jgi:hypothetical protein